MRVVVVVGRRLDEGKGLFEDTGGERSGCWGEELAVLSFVVLSGDERMARC